MTETVVVGCVRGDLRKHGFESWWTVAKDRDEKKNLMGVETRTRL